MYNGVSSKLPPTAEQMAVLKKLCEEHGFDIPAIGNRAQAKMTIVTLKNRVKAKSAKRAKPDSELY